MERKQRSSSGAYTTLRSRSPANFAAGMKHSLFLAVSFPDIKFLRAKALIIIYTIFPFRTRQIGLNLGQTAQKARGGEAYENPAPKP